VVQRITRLFRLAGPMLATAGLCACNGTVTVDLADTPVDGATAVVIDFTGIVLHGTDGKTTTVNFSSPQQIDLLQLQNGLTQALLQNASVPAGSYDWMQLKILANANTQGQSYITLNTGAQYPLYVPAASQSALTITTPFSVGQSGTTRLVIEFNLRQSVTSTDGQNYTLVPAMHLANESQVGTLTAAVDLAGLAAQQLGSAAQISQCSGGLFVFSGSSVTPQNGGGASLIDLQPMPYDGGTTQASVSFPYLPKGGYTVAATCDYNLYDPTATPGGSGYQALHWTVLKNLTVTANSTATGNLPASTTSNVVN
jgi:Domain of unknown function (DUF4382)